MKNTHIKFLSYTVSLFLLVVSYFLVTGNSNNFFGANNSNNTLVVEASAMVKAEADIAKFSFTVAEVADVAEEGQKVVSKKISLILDGLKELEIDDKDIQTDSYSITPKYQWVKVQKEDKTAPDGTVYSPNDNSQVLIGYDARQMVTITIRDIKNASETLVLLADSGVENLSGPNFEISDIEVYEDKARDMAIETAQVKAQKLAKSLGVKINGVVSFNEQNNDFFPSLYKRNTVSSGGIIAQAEDYSPELPTGENNVVSNVTVIYEIK